MKICGIIAEFNPLHNGHAFLLDRARNIAQGNDLVCVMSGSLTERGDVAVADKYTRAKHAVTAGADMVIELPVISAISSAELFAYGAVNALNSLEGFETLIFGSECGDIEALKSAESLTASHSLQPSIKRGLSAGLNYPRAVAEAIKEHAPELTVLDSPNNVLGVEYLRAIRLLNLSVTAHTVKRDGAAHNDTAPLGNNASSGYIRECAAKSNFNDLKDFMPSYSAHDIAEYRDTSDRLFAIIKFAALTQNLPLIAGMKEGIENRIKAAAADSVSYSDLLSRIKTKRYSMARIKRILLNIAISVSEEHTALTKSAPDYTNVLAIAEDKKYLLSAIKNTVVTMPKNLPAFSSLAALTERADCLQRTVSFISAQNNGMAVVKRQS